MSSYPYLKEYLSDAQSIVMCIGANWLHERPVVEDDDNVIYDKEMELVPPKHWAWYALTTDCK